MNSRGRFVEILRGDSLNVFMKACIEKYVSKDTLLMVNLHYRFTDFLYLNVLPIFAARCRRESGVNEFCLDL